MPVKICFIIVKYWTGSGLVEAPFLVDLRDQLGVAFLPADPQRRVGVRDHVEDQEDDHRDREQDAAPSRSAGGG